MVKDGPMKPMMGDLSRDPDSIHQKLWARKKLKKRQARNEDKKMRKAYFKMKDQSDSKGDGEIGEKHSQFYKSLFEKNDENAE